MGPRRLCCLLCDSAATLSPSKAERQLEPYAAALGTYLQPLERAPEVPPPRRMSAGQVPGPLTAASVLQAATDATRLPQNEGSSEHDESQHAGASADKTVAHLPPIKTQIGTELSSSSSSSVGGSSGVTDEGGISASSSLSSPSSFNQSYPGRESGKSTVPSDVKRRQSSESPATLFSNPLAEIVDEAGDLETGEPLTDAPHGVIKDSDIDLSMETTNLTDKHVAWRSMSLVPNLLSAAEAAAAEDPREPHADQVSAEPKARRYPTDVSMIPVDEDISPEETVHDAWNESANDTNLGMSGDYSALDNSEVANHTYFEHDVPLSSRHRFPTAVPDLSDSASEADSRLHSRTQSFSSIGDILLCSSSISSGQEGFITSSVRQSWDPHRKSPVRKPSIVPSLRLSALGLDLDRRSKDLASPKIDTQNTFGMDAKVVSTPQLHRNSNSAQEITNGSKGSRMQASDDENARTPRKKSPLSELKSVNVLPFGDATSRMNSAANSPSTAANSPLAAGVPATVFLNAFSSMPANGASGTSPQKMPSNPISLLQVSKESLSARMNAAAQASRQYSLRGAAAAGMPAAVAGRRNRATSTLADVSVQEVVAPEATSNLNEGQPYPESPKGQSSSVATLMPSSNTGRQRYVLDVSDDLRESLVEIGTPASSTYNDEPAAAGVIYRALAARSAIRTSTNGGRLRPSLIYEDIPEHVSADMEYGVHTNSMFSEPHVNIGDWSSGRAEDDSSGWELTQFDIDNLASASLDGPQASEEPKVTGGKRGRIADVPARGGPLRREVATNLRESFARKSKASIGHFSIYGNDTFREGQEDEPSSSTGDVSTSSCGQLLRPLSAQLITSQALTPTLTAPRALWDAEQVHGGETGQSTKVYQPSPDMHPGVDLNQGMAPLTRTGPAPVGLTPRVGNSTLHSAAQGGPQHPYMTPRTVSTMDDLLQTSSVGTAIKLLYDGDDRSKEAAAGALHKMAQQERYKMAICRVEGGIEALASSAQTLKTAAGRQLSASALCALASHPGCCAVVADHGGISAFVSLSASTLAEDQVIAARGLGYLATIDHKRSNFLDAGGAYALVCLLEAKESRVREAAARALWNLAYRSEECRTAIASAGSLHVLLEMVQADATPEVAAAAGALWNLSASTGIQKTLADLGGIPVLVSVIYESGNPGAQLAASGALCNLMLRHENRPIAIEAGVCKALVEALECGHASVKSTTARAMYVLAADRAGCEAVTVADGAQPLAVEAANGNEMAAWAIKRLLAFKESREIALKAGSLQALCSLLRTPTTSSEGLEAAAWGLRSLTEANQADGLHDMCQRVVSAGGVAALLMALNSKHSSHVFQEGAVRTLWNLCFKDSQARIMIAETDALKSILTIGESSSSTECRQAVAGVLWNLSMNNETRESVLSSGGVKLLLRLALEADSDSDDGANVALKAICTLSFHSFGTDALLKSGALEVLSSVLLSETKTSADSAKNVIATIYNCLIAAMKIQDSPGASPEMLQAVCGLVDSTTAEDSSIRSIAFKGLRGVLGSPSLARAAVDAGAVAVIGNYTASSLRVGESVLHIPVLSKEELNDAIWIIEGLAFHDFGQDVILSHEKLLHCLVELLRLYGEDVQLAACRILHNLTANTSMDVGVLHNVPGLLPVMLEILTDDRASPSICESAVWSIKSLTAMEPQRQNLLDLHGIQAICHVFESDKSTHSMHQAAALVIRNLSTARDHAIAIGSTAPAIIGALLRILDEHNDQDCQNAAVGAIANLSAVDEIKAIVRRCEGPAALVKSLASSNPVTRQAAARALANLAYHSEDAALAILEAGGGDRLLAMLKSADTATFAMDTTTASLAISNMAAHSKARSALVTAGAVPVVGRALARITSKDMGEDVSAMGSSTGVSVSPEESCIRALWGLAPDVSAAQQMASDGTIALLLGILSNAAFDGKPRAIARCCNGALRAVTSTEASREAILKGGVLEQLIGVLRAVPAPEAAEAAAFMLWDLAVTDESTAAVAALGGIPALVGLLSSSRPSTRHAAIGALHNLSFSEQTKEALLASGAVAVLIALLGERTPECSAIAANMLKVLALNNAAKLHIVQAGGVLALCDLLEAKVVDVQEAAAGALRNLATSKSNKVAIMRAGALPRLVELMRDTNGPGCQYSAAGALCNMAFNSTVEVKEAIVESKALPLLSILMNSTPRGEHGTTQSGPTIQLLAARTMWNLASGSDSNRHAMHEAGCIPALVAALAHGEDGIQAVAAGALSHLAIDASLKDSIREAGGVPHLAALVEKGALSSGFQAAASVLRNLAVVPSAKASIVEAGLIQTALSLLSRPSSNEVEQVAAKGILRSLAFNSPTYSTMIQQLAGGQVSLDELLA